MKRRNFIRRAALASAGVALLAKARSAPAVARFASEGGKAAAERQPEAWRVFEITTRVDVLQASGDATRVWLPTPLPAAPYQKTLGDTYHAAGGRTAMIETDANEPDILGAVWEDGNPAVLTLTSRVTTKDHAVDLREPVVPPPPDMSSFGRFLKATKYIPIDGIVKKTSDAITGRTGTDLERARKIYDWIVENTFRDPKVRGCGIGDIRFMLESNNLGGKCADLNALFVGLARAAGIPARDVYGLRVAKSAHGLRSLGLSSADATKAQHCRAEVYLSGFGWVPVDPADVRKVVLEEPPGNLAITDEKVVRARARLFGSWEMNWIAYNFAHDVALRGSSRKPLGYFMYPQGETADGPIDSLDPEQFSYSIAVTEVGGP
jgi:transglutaminase-like putative cysteine protease